MKIRNSFFILALLAPLLAIDARASFDEVISEAQSHAEGGRCVGPSRDGQGNDFHLWDNPATTGWHCFCRSLPFNGKECNAFPSRQDLPGEGQAGYVAPPPPVNIASPPEPHGPSGDPVAIIDPVTMPDSGMGRSNENGALDSASKARDLFSNNSAATAANRSGSGVKAANKDKDTTLPLAANKHVTGPAGSGSGADGGAGTPQTNTAAGSGTTTSQTGSLNTGVGSGSDIATSGEGSALAAANRANSAKSEFELARELNGPNGPGSGTGADGSGGGASDMTLGSGDSSSASSRLSEAEAEEEFMRGRRPTLFEIVNYRYGRLTKRIHD